MEALDPTARIVWKLARNHTWGQPIPEADLIALTTHEEDRDEMRAHLDTALELPFLRVGPHGVFIPNGQDAHCDAANWLQTHTDLPVYAIAATLSRLPPDWPDAA